MRYASHIADLVGNTPLVRLNSVTTGLAATVLALRDRGALDLHAPITEYVPQLHARHQGRTRADRRPAAV